MISTIISEFVLSDVHTNPAQKLYTRCTIKVLSVYVIYSMRIDSIGRNWGIFLTISAFWCRYNQDNEMNKFRHFHAIVITDKCWFDYRISSMRCVVRACVWALVKSTNDANSRHVCAVCGWFILLYRGFTVTETHVSFQMVTKIRVKLEHVKKP